MEQKSKQVRLSDGRILGYVEYGDPSGKPIFYFHGWPSSRLEARLSDRIATKIGACIISIDRPGFGLSTFKRSRTFIDWPNDVSEFADKFQFDHFAVLGVSGGSPYAASCAFKIPHRLAKVAIVSGVGSLDLPEVTKDMNNQNRRLVTIARKVPWLLRLPIAMVKRRTRNPETFFLKMAAEMSKQDKVIFTKPEVRQMFLDSTIEAFRKGIKGALCEAPLYIRPWGFDLQDISMEVYLWHGQLDINVPVHIGRAQANVLPNCRASFLPNEGHLFLLKDEYMEEVLSTLIS